MNKLVLLLAAVGMASAACQSDSRGVEDRLNARLDRIEKKIDDMAKNGGARPGAAAQPTRAPRPEPDRAKTYSLAVDGDPFDGPADAKVTLVKAYDYACPYCERVRDTMDQLRQKYGNDLRVVYKQFVVHPQVATAGALAFCAAAKQGKAHEMDAALWDKGFKQHQFDKDGDNGQKCWESDAGCPVVLGFGKDIGLNVDKLKADMKGCVQLMQKDMRDLQALGVGATPSFFVNGRFMSGAMPIENFQQLIDEELKKANDTIAKEHIAASDYYQKVVVDRGQKTLDAPKQ
ncbi:MAG: thioredoxin domain-containing protein [Deltaproteobacteria bacterium]|nr:thioredoxin domain-containing protein [Deltaproteobacteria bacterium]